MIFAHGVGRSAGVVGPCAGYHDHLALGTLSQSANVNIVGCWAL
ncbi:MAG: hypothetical protein JWO51_2244, partial [Rhodospirillales bacterium]|nr:hypothetical protein [Rhodospirillales bacterium]